MGVLRLLNVAPTQLHPNSWAYLQAFRLLCMALYLEPSPRVFLYFFVTRPKSPITWLSLISRPGPNKLEAFTQSFKHFKDGFFKVVVKPASQSHFYTADGNTKFPFFWTGNPWRYKVISREDLSVGEKDVVDTLMQFSDKMPTKGLVRVYNLVHPIIDIEGHMAQLGKKNLTLFQALRKEKAVKAKVVGNTMVPNLQDSLVDVHVHGGTKRKAELPIRAGKGKEVKKVRAAVMGAGSASGVKGPEAGLIEFLETTVRKDIEINVPESLINSIDNIEPRALVKAMVEFSSKTLLLSRCVGSLYERELKEGNRTKVEELQEKVDKHGEEKETWKKEKEEWDLERKRLATWRVRCLDSEEKLKGRIADLEADYDDIKEKHDGLEGELEDLKSCIILEHINGFQKGVRQASFYYENVDANDVRFDVNKDVVDGVLIDEAKSSPEGNGEKEAVDADVGGNEVVAKDVEQKAA
ncbi:hypothetical protein DEO72_LG4g291 [Vigna unguiculata]|uniref:Transposase n=1 Tax=Vigna unguiculata TaxID=3917 RepID=A0A4D6LL80_VIGUN|nr:hypothetical protein DEO72_LG4g291 [Vigna unguiculata]